MKDIFINNRNLFDKCLRKTQREYNISVQTHIDSLSTKDPKAFWEELRKLGPKGNTKPDTYKVQLDHDGSVSDDPNIVLEKWKGDFEALYQANGITGYDNGAFIEDICRLSQQWEEQYERVLTQREVEMNEVSAESIRQASATLNHPIALQETVNSLKTLRNGKAVGIDNIANEILKVQTIQNCLHSLFASCFEYGMVPRMWLQWIIHPILKRGKNPLFPTNHRGISLMSMVCKAFSSIINNRIVLYMELSGLFVDEQNGFRRLRSCLDHIYVLTTILRNRKQQGLSAYCCFIDLQKAFDSVRYPLLWHKMLAYGIHGKILDVIRSLYRNLQSCVRVNGRFTDWFSQSAGVLQGDTLAPTLFAIFINDLAMEIKALDLGVPIQNYENVSILLFADDIVLISESQENLQTMMNTAGDWSNRWSLKMNYDKTKVMHFHKQSVPRSDYQFEIHGNDIETTASYRYLGLDINETVDHTHGVRVLNTAASRALGGVIARYLATDGLSHDVYKKLFDVTVAPVMDYGCEVWGTKPYECCSTLQHRAMRTFLGVGKCAPLPAMYTDLQWKPAFVRYWCRLRQMPECRLTRRVFDWDHTLATRGRRSWNKEVKDILAQCNIPEAFDRDCWHRYPTDLIIGQVKQQLTEQAHLERRTAGATMSRLKIYNDCGFQPPVTPDEPDLYIRSNLSRTQRSHIARLRTGTLPIAIETGRYRHIPANERLCKYCTSEEVEDEFHILFTCSLYQQLKNLFNLDNINNRSNHLRSLLSSKHGCRQLANYLMKVLKSRGSQRWT